MPNKKGAQDAHEAIRPTDIRWDPDIIKKDLTADQFKLYRLIWKRFVSSQMTPEISLATTISLTAGDCEFRSAGSVVLFDGFTAVDRDDKTKKESLPDINEGDQPGLEEYISEQHFTTPPPRYNDASLVKFLEESGIGRPSTYAPTINTLIKRYYVVRHGRQLAPTVLGRIVNDIMAGFFSSLVSIDFTSDMEAKLDLIEENRSDWVSMLGEFYGPFKGIVDHAEEHIEEMKNILDEETDIICEKCGRKMLKRLGKFGFFIACPGFPECRNARPIPLGRCPIDGCGGEIVKRSSKKGRPFFACTNYPECTFITRESPTDKECPTCSSILFMKRKKNEGETLFCLREGCGYKIEILDN